jgi:1-acyl-sn-glycerol-3-phosphate acyltransferase
LERYFLEPYRFIPPFKGTFWCHVARRVVPRHLRRRARVQRWQFDGLDALRASLDKGAGILLAPNHSRWADPMIVGIMAASLRKYLYYIASYHLFKQSRFMGWFMNRIGSYSIWREGTDRESIRTTAHILAEAERPVVLFPEGTWFRQNDRVGPLQEGLALIVRQAVKLGDRPILIHPVGLKYWVLADPTSELNRRLEALEVRLGWRPAPELGLVARLERVSSALLALKEIELLGAARSGSVDERTQHVLEAEVARQEKVHLGKTFDGWVLERIRRLRQSLVRRLLEAEATGGNAALKHDLDTLLFCENLNAHSIDYVRERPSPERLVETLQRIEEILTDAEKPVVRLGVTVRVGPAIDVRQRLAGADGLIPELRAQIQAQVDHLLAQGPPAAWGCPNLPPLPA